MLDRVRRADDPEVVPVADLIRGRRTINLFEPDAVAADVLLDAIDLARWAPNHRLTEPWKFYLLGKTSRSAAIECWAEYEAETKGEAARDARRQRLEAIPGHFVLTSKRDDDDVIDLENYAACCCAAQNLMLYLWQRGVGAKWTTGAITRESRLYETLDIDELSERIVGYFWYGIPKIVGEQNRRGVDEIAVLME